MSPVTQDKLVNYLMDRTDKFGSYINELAKQLGVAAEHVYGVLIRQQYAEAVGTLIEAFILLCVFIVLTVFFVLGWKRANHWLEKGYDEWQVGMIIGTVVYLVASAFIIVEITSDVKDGIMRLLNPEYYALKDIMDFIQSKVKQ